MIVHLDRPGLGQRRYPGHRGMVDGAWRDIAEIFLDQRPRLGGGNVSGDHQHRVIGAIACSEPRLDVGEARSVEIGDRADGSMVIRMAGREQAAEHLVLDEPAGTAVALPLLVLDNRALVIHHTLRHRAE